MNDQRERTMTFIDTYYTASNVQHRNEVTSASAIVGWGHTVYPLKKVFIEKEVDIVCNVVQAQAKTRRNFNHKAYGYDDDCRLVVEVMDKPRFDADVLLNSYIQELRRIFELYPGGSLRGFTESMAVPRDMGGWLLYTGECRIVYRREADQAGTTAQISYGMGAIVDGDKKTGGKEGTWNKTDAGGHTSTFTIVSGDMYRINVTVGNAAGSSYIKNATNLGLSTDTYTKIRWRYYTQGANVKAQIIVGDDGAYSQTVLAETASTGWTVGSATLTAAKTLDHIFMYANKATAGATDESVYYDYVQIYRNDFTFPNIVSVDPDYQARSPRRGIPSKSGDLTQKLGSKSTNYIVKCDFSIGTWTATGFADKNGEVFLDILHEGGIDEPWQLLNLETDQIKFCLDRFNVPMGEGEEIATLEGHEYRLGTASSESTKQRWSLDQ